MPYNFSKNATFSALERKLPDFIMLIRGVCYNFSLREISSHLQEFSRQQISQSPIFSSRPGTSYKSGAKNTRYNKNTPNLRMRPGDSDKIGIYCDTDFIRYTERSLKWNQGIDKVSYWIMPPETPN